VRRWGVCKPYTQVLKENGIIDAQGNRIPNKQIMVHLTPYIRIIETTKKPKIRFTPATGGNAQKGGKSKKAIKDLNFFLTVIVPALKKTYWRGYFGYVTYIPVKNRFLLKYAQLKFAEYMREYGFLNKYVVLEKPTEKGIKRIVLPVYTRYDKPYQKRVKKRLNWLSYEYRKENAVLLTLTINPDKFFNDKTLMWLTIKKEVHRFFMILKKYLNKHNRKLPKYIMSIEAQKNGNPHIHIAFLGCKRLIDWRIIRRMWGLGHIYINRTKKEGKIRYPIKYISKYISKTFLDTDKGDVNLTVSLCWLFGIRSFSTSRGLFYPLNKKGMGEYLIAGMLLCTKDVNIEEIKDFVDNIDDNPLNPVLKDHWIGD